MDLQQAMADYGLQLTIIVKDGKVQGELYKYPWKPGVLVAVSQCETIESVLEDLQTIKDSDLAKIGDELLMPDRT